jgi:putative tryptophan/tyrosine transport system substrate-binding protein
MKKRRELLVALGAGAVIAPVSVFAQSQTKVWRVGFLHEFNRPAAIENTYFGAFVEGMRDLGYVVGKNLLIEWRFADNAVERAAAMAAELVRQGVDVIVAANGPMATTAKNATSTVPIVMASSGDPVVSGLVKTLARPGGNITGLSNITADIIPRHLGLLADMVPGLSRVAVLVSNTSSSASLTVKSANTAAKTARIAVFPVVIRPPDELESAFTEMTRQKAGALIVVRFNSHVRQISQLAAKHRLPAIAGLREYVDAGGLMSYGSNTADQFRRAATFVDKIFRGAKPGDLPIEQPTKFELFINGKAAKALGLKVPNSLLISADKVIE